MRLMPFHNRIWFKRGQSWLSSWGLQRKGKKFEYNIGQSNVVTRYTGGTDGDLSA